MSDETLNQPADESLAGAQAGLEGAPSVDELHEEALDHEADEKALKDSLLPAYTYTTVPEVKVNVYTNDDGRKVARLFGHIIAVDNKTGQTIEGNIGTSLSWQRRDNPETGKPDGATKRYLGAKRAFKEAMGHEPATAAELLNYLVNYPTRWRVTQFNGDNFVVNISAVRE